MLQSDRLRDLIQRSQQLDRRIVELQHAISELQRRFDPLEKSAKKTMPKLRPHVSARSAVH